MKITDITSIIAICLSIINLVLIIKRDFLKEKPYLNINVKDAKIRYLKGDKTTAQIIINMSITSIGKYNGIKKMILRNTQYECFNFSKEYNYIVLKNYYKELYSNDIFKDISFGDFEKYVQSINREKRDSVENIFSEVDKPFRFTLLDQLRGYRWSDGYDDFPDKGFELVMIDLFDNEHIIDLNFKKINE